MIDARVKVAAGLLIGVLSLLGTVTAAHARPVIQTHYACDHGEEFVVRRSGHRASVQFPDRTYELRMARSSIGQKFLSQTAALIVDGPSAVFVADNRLQLGQCLEVSQIASSE